MKMPVMLEKMMFGFIESQVLFVCDELRIFDYLVDNGASSLYQISLQLKLPASSVERLLICATSINLLQKNDDIYCLHSDWIPFLSRKSDLYCGNKFTHYFKSSYKIFDFLNHGIVENKPQWTRLKANINNQNDLNSVYTDYIYSNENSTVEFLSTMWASGYNDSIDLCHKYSFSNYHTLVDLGGATGSFAIAAMQKYHNLKSIIMDFETVEPYANEMLIAHKLENRGCFYSGDIFKNRLPQGDVYVIGYLLSDWPEAMCVSLIQKVYDSLPVGGLIVILEKLFDDDKSGPYLTAMLNLTMLLEMHGQHRSAPEYFSWLEAAGFRDCRVIYSAGEKHMVVGVKEVQRLV